MTKDQTHCPYDGSVLPADREKRQQDVHRDIVENAVMGIYITTLDGRILYANEKMWRMFDCLSIDQFLDAGAERFYRKPGVRQRLLKRIQTEGSVTGEDIEITTQRGELRHLSISVSLCGDRMIGMALDITDQRQAEEALRQSEARYAQLAEQSRTTVWEVDPKGLYTYMSPSVFALLGYMPEELVGTAYFYDLCPAEDREQVKRFGMVDCIGAGADFSNYENRLQTRTGEVIWVMSSGLPLRDETGCVVGYRGIDMDITTRKRAEERLQYLSTHDVLTKAGNRALFEEEMARLERSRQYPVSVIMADIDDLKGINDTEGHASGDRVLQCACQVLRHAVRAEDMVARIGGDEFAVLLPQTDDHMARQLASRVYQGVEQHNRKDGHRPLSMAIGVATAQAGETLLDVLRRADAQMYAGKRRCPERTVSREQSG